MKKAEAAAQQWHAVAREVDAQVTPAQVESLVDHLNKHVLPSTVARQADVTRRGRGGVLQMTMGPPWACRVAHKWLTAHGFSCTCNARHGLVCIIFV